MRHFQTSDCGSHKSRSSPKSGLRCRGGGLSPALMLAFETFDRAGRRDGAGLGLGLHIVHQTAQSLGHPVVVQSRCGRGSIFGVTVNAARRELATFG